MKLTLRTLAELAENYGWKSLDVAETQRRAEMILGVLMDFERFQYHAPKLLRSVDRALLALADHREGARSSRAPAGQTPAPILSGPALPLPPAH